MSFDEESEYLINLNNYTILDVEPEENKDICTAKVKCCSSLVLSMYRENVENILNVLDEISIPIDTLSLNIMCQYYEHFGWDLITQELHNLNNYMWETDINFQNNRGESALFIACIKYGIYGPDMIDTLIRYGANINKTTPTGENILLYVCDDDDITNRGELILKIIELGADVNCQREKYLYNETRNEWTMLMDIPKYDWTPLMIMCNDSEPNQYLEQIITSLIKSGADVNFVCKDGYYPLYLICSNDQLDNNIKIQLAKTLLENKAHPDRANPYVSEFLETPLMLSARRKHYELVKLLIDFGANASHCIKKYLDGEGMHPIDYALFPDIIDDNVYKIVQILIENGANINKNYSALMRLAEKEYLTSEFFDNQDKYYDKTYILAQLLLDSRAELDIRHKGTGNTALMLAVHSCNYELVNKLSGSGANPNIQNHKGQTALTIGSEPKRSVFSNYRRQPSYYHRIISQLVNAGADLNICTDPEKTNLLIEVIASIKKDGYEDISEDIEYEKKYLNNVVQIVELLVKTDINLDQQDLFGWTAIMHLMDIEKLGVDEMEYLIKIKILDLLVNAGAKLDIKNKKGHDVFTVILNKIKSLQSCCIKDLEIVIRAGVQFSMKDYKYSDFKIILRYIKQKIKIEELQQKISELEGENLHLRYSPDGYYNARDHFTELSKLNNK